MRDWSQYNTNSILSGSDEKGDRLVLEFAKDYKQIIGADLCISCRKSFPFQYNKFLNYYGMRTNTTEYVVHTKFNGVTLPGWRNKALSNTHMTEEKALYYIVNHPKGKSLFKKLPHNVDERIEEYQKPKVFDIDTANGKELKAYAKQNNIDLGEATKVGDIREVVKDWQKVEEPKEEETEQ